MRASPLSLSLGGYAARERDLIAPYLLSGARPGLLYDATAGISRGPGLNLTRTTTGTYTGLGGTIETAAIDAPRFDWSAGSRDLLVEASRTNITLYSGAMTTSPWSAVGVTTSSADTAPDGTSLMARAVANAGTGDRAFTQTVSLTIGAPYTVSAFVRRDQHRFAMMFGFGNGGNGVAFDLVSGTAQVNGTWDSAGIELLNSTHARIWGVVTPAANGTAYFGLASDLTGAKVFAGGETLSFWGAQIEAGSTLTSYIATEGAAVTRAADLSTADLTGLNLSAAVTLSLTVSAASYGMLYQADDGTDANHIGLFYDSTDGHLYAQMDTATMSQANVDLGAYDGGAVSVAITATTDNFQAARDGAAIAAVTPISYATLSAQRYGTTVAGTDAVARMLLSVNRVFPGKSASQAELEALSV